MNYYNEIDPYCCKWLANLIDAREIPKGHIDSRSIVEVTKDDLDGYTQCHFFAGIAGWSLALRLAGIEADTPLFTGSCPCQPFSIAGKRKGINDERHLWPEFYRLISECAPNLVLGEQVASADGRKWLSGVQTDLEALGFAFGAADLCAAGINAPHIRQRLYWMAYNQSHGLEGRRTFNGAMEGIRKRSDGLGSSGEFNGRMADARQQLGSRGERRSDAENTSKRYSETIYDQRCSEIGWLGEPNYSGLEGRSNNAREYASEQFIGDTSVIDGLSNASGERLERSTRESLQGRISGPSSGGFWDEYNLIPCLDGKARRIKPGIKPLAHGIYECLEQMRTLENEAIQEVIKYANQKTGTSKAVSLVYENLYAKMCRQESSIGVSGQFCSEKILQCFLQCLLSACTSESIPGVIPQKGAQVFERSMRFMHLCEGIDYPSCGWQSVEQYHQKSTDSMCILSLVLARIAEAYWKVAREANATINRNDKLRAYGNAIVAPLAAKFIEAAMESIKDL